MMDEFEAMFNDVISGKSIRDCEKQYGINRNTFVTMCKQIFPEGSEQREKLERVLSYNKSELQKKAIDEKRLSTIIKGLLTGNIPTLNEAKSLYLKKGEKIDLQTFKENIVEYINSSNDDELKREYIEYEARRHPDYSHINFKALFIEMISEEASQTDMATKYGIPPRTISRELAKLENDEEYKPIYEIAKELAKRKMQKANAKYDTSLFEPLERILIQTTLENYDEGEVIISNPKTEAEKKYEKAKSLLEQVEQLHAPTIKEAAGELGISISTIRRAGKTVEAYEKLTGKDEQDDESRK